MDTELSALIDVGFTQSEARTYLLLLEIKEARTGVLCATLKIPSAHIYRILESLMGKGVVSYKLINNIKVFKANPPETLDGIFLEKQEGLERQRQKMAQVISRLKCVPLPEDQQSDYKYFEGIAGVKAMWLEIRGIMKPKSTYVVYASTKESFERMNAFYLDTHKLRARKKISERMILPIDAKRYAHERKKLGRYEARYLDLDNEAEFGAFGDFMYLQYTHKRSPKAFLIKDEIFAKTFTSIFDKLWAQAKK